MRKFILVGLAMAAFAIYSWDIFLFARPRGGERAAGSGPKKSDFSLDKLISSSKPVRFVEKGRSPFLPSRPIVKPVAHEPPAPKAPLRAKETPKPPDVKVTGLIWSQSAPLAMVTLPDGSGVVARAGQSFGEIAVKKIEKNRMLISYQKRDFWIAW